MVPGLLLSKTCADGESSASGDFAGTGENLCSGFSSVGSDFNGGGLVSGCEDISRLPFITAELVRRGYSERDLRKFWGENTLRVLGTARA